MQIFNQTFKVKALYMKSTQTWNISGVDDCSTILDMLEARPLVLGYSSDMVFTVFLCPAQGDIW